jgi:hypothetical protein
VEIQEPIESVYFGHAFFKAFQDVNINEIVGFGLQLVDINVAQFSIQDCII